MEILLNHEDLKVTPETIKRMYWLSASTIDRLLWPYKSLGVG